MPATLAREHRQGSCDALKRAPQVYVDHAVPALDVERVETRDRSDTGAVDDDIEPATLLHRKGDEGFETVPPSHIGDLRRGVSAGSDDRRHDLRKDIATTRAQHHECAAFGQQRRGRAADAAARAGDGDDLAFDTLLDTKMGRAIEIAYDVSSMVLSRSSKGSGDPLSDVLNILGAQDTRHTRLEAAGRWGFAFPAINRLKFVALLRGDVWILLPGCAPQRMNEGDVCLLGRAAYAVASHATEIPIDGQMLYADCDVAHVGGAETIAIGGTVTFSAGSADFLLDMLPTFMLLPRATPSADAVAMILGLTSRESENDRVGSEIAAARLADVLLVEASVPMQHATM